MKFIVHACVSAAGLVEIEVSDDGTVISAHTSEKFDMMCPTLLLTHASLHPEDCQILTNHAARAVVMKATSNLKEQCPGGALVGVKKDEASGPAN